MESELNKIDWKNLESASGDGSDVPDLLLKLYDSDLEA